MMTPPQPHLSDEQLSALVEGQAPTPAEAEHLAACAVCTARLGDLRALRAGLRALAAVGDVPDFRLGPGGAPRRATTTRPMPPPRPSLVARLAGGMALVCGLALLLIAVTQSSTVATLRSEAAAPAGNSAQSTAATPPTCTAHECFAAGEPTQSITPTPARISVPSSTPHDATTSSAASPPLALEWGLGALLTLGGGVTLIRARKR